MFVIKRKLNIIKIVNKQLLELLQLQALLDNKINYIEKNKYVDILREKHKEFIKHR